MIWVDNISKYFYTKHGRHYVLRDTSFYIPPLAKVGVIGRNGAGKSTLMGLLAGIDVPNSGKIYRQGRISWPLGLASGLQSSMTGRENARFACRIQGLGYEEMAEKLEFIQSFAEIGRYFDELVRTYSSGMRARLNFGIAMAFDFECYLIDELTAVGDETFKNKSKRIFEEKKSRAGYIMVSHGLKQLVSDCQAGLLLHEGKAQYYESIEEAVERYRSEIGTLEDDEQGRKGRRRNRKRASLEDVAEGLPAEASSKRKRKRRKESSAEDAEPVAAAVAGNGDAPDEARKSRRRKGRGEAKTAADGNVDAEARKSRRRARKGRAKSAVAETEAPAVEPVATAVAPEPARAPVQVGRAPFAPRIPRELPARAAADRGGDVASGLTPGKLLTLLRGGSVRK